MPSETPPGFFGRLGIAFSVFFRILGDAMFAGGVSRLRAGGRVLGPGEEPAPERPRLEKPKADKPKPVLKESGPEAALQLLALLQREGRLVDFLEEDIAGFTDAQVGAAARVVHDQCRAVLREHLPVEPIRAEEEGSSITLAGGFDAAKVRLTGKVAGEPPFTGTLGHRGWKVREVKLPKLAEGHDASVIAPAEVEL